MGGHHNVRNALAAVATGLWLNLSPDSVCDALGRYEAPPMRMSREVVGDVVLVNDAYNANPRSMEAAIRELASRPSEGRRVAVLGDMLELGARAAELHSELGEYIAGMDVHSFFGIGTWMQAAVRAAQVAGLQTARHFERMETLVEAVTQRRAQ